MATVAELIEYLSDLPPDTEVYVVQGYDHGWSYGTKNVNLDLDPLRGNVDFTDLTGNPHVKQDSDLYNKAILILGEA